MKIYTKEVKIKYQESPPVTALEINLYQMLYDFKDSIISIDVTLSDGEGNTSRMIVMR
jgi:hypothetical protein